MIKGDTSISGVALADQVKNLDWRARELKFAASVDVTILEDVIAKFEALLRSA
jgi:mRNA interferase MazF